MADYITKIRTDKGDLPIDYNSLVNLPHTDIYLRTENEAADAKATGDAIDALSADIEKRTSDIATELSALSDHVNQTIEQTLNDISTNINELSTTLTTRLEEVDAQNLNKSGDEMTGVLSMGENKITNLADPTDNTDAVNKQYVDSKHFVVNATLTAEWTTEAAPYTQVVSVDGILETDCPHITPIYSETLETAMLQRESWSMICNAETSDGAITFACFLEIPRVEIPIQIEVHR